MEDRTNNLLSSQESVFQSWFLALFRRYSLWRACLFVASFFIALVLIFSLYAVLDYSLGLGMIVRTIISSILLMVLIYMIRQVRGFFFISEEQVARAMSDVQHDPRQTILSYWQISHPQEPDYHPQSPMATWLAGKLEIEASTSIQTFRWGRLPHIRRELWVMSSALVLLIVGMILALSCPRATHILCARIFTPWVDTVPLSPLSFSITPMPIEVVYGDDVTLEACIDGGVPSAPILLYVKPSDGSQDYSLYTFQSTEKTYVRKLERMTAPCLIAFGSQDGRSRSEWLPVQIIYRPKIVSGTVTITPPEYVHQKPVILPLSGSDISLLEGSSITVNIQSNRPLMAGEMVLTPSSEKLPKLSGSSTILPDNQIVFTLTVRYSGLLSISLSDIQGTSMLHPQENSVRVRPDVRASLVIHSPEPVSFAIEGTEVQFKAEAQDDFGLLQVSWLRGVMGSRPRPKIMLLSPGATSLFIDESVSLNKIGAKAGDVLLFGLEARDTNPFHLNMSNAPPSVVYIISKQEAERLMQYRADLEHFSEKFEMLNTAIQETLQAIEDAKKDPAADMSELAKKLEEAHRKAIATSIIVEQQFPAFEQEKALQTIAKELGARLSENLSAIQSIPSVQSSQHVQSILTNLAETISPSATASGKLAQSAQQSQKVMDAYYHLFAFKELIERQQSITNDLEIYLKQSESVNSKTTTDQLQSISVTQKELCGDLILWAQKNQDILHSLDTTILPTDSEEECRQKESVAKFKSTMIRFIQAYEGSNISSLMLECVDSILESKPRTAQEQASLIHQLMKDLLYMKSKNGQNSGESCSSWPFNEGEDNQVESSASDPLSSMIQSLCSQLSPSEFPVKGISQSADGSGYGMMGKASSLPPPSPFSSPIHGIPQLGSSLKQMKQGGNRSGQLPSTQNTGSHTVLPQDSPNQQEKEIEGQSVESVPSRYRDAVHKYFQTSPPLSP